MTEGVKTIVFPVGDLVKAKAVFEALGVRPYMDEPYYVGFSVGGQDIGLDPHGHRTGGSGPVCYFHVPDITAGLRAVLEAGAVLEQDVRDVGGGKLSALVRAADGHTIGLVQAGGAER